MKNYNKDEMQNQEGIYQEKIPEEIRSKAKGSNKDKQKEILWREKECQGIQESNF